MAALNARGEVDITLGDVVLHLRFRNYNMRMLCEMLGMTLDEFAQKLASNKAFDPQIITCLLAAGAAHNKLLKGAPVNDLLEKIDTLIDTEAAVHDRSLVEIWAEIMEPVMTALAPALAKHQKKDEPETAAAES